MPPPRGVCREIHDVSVIIITGTIVLQTRAHLRLLLFPPWTLDEIIEKYFFLRKFRCNITFFIPWGPTENMSIEVNHVSHETLWETRVHKTRRHHKDGEIWFIVRLDTFPLQVVCYYYCYRREKSKGVGIVSSGFVSNERSQRVIMTKIINRQWTMRWEVKQLAHR